jgi:protein Tex
MSATTRDPETPLSSSLSDGGGKARLHKPERPKREPLAEPPSAPSAAPARPARLPFEDWFRGRHPAIPTAGALATLKLAAEGGTVPFIARYRKEQTGGLDEVAIQTVIESRARFDRIVTRQDSILSAIEHQKKLTPELEARILSCYEPEVLEDLYLPYKQKRTSKASRAREAGLLPLADWIWACGHGTEVPQPGQTLELWAFTFRNEEQGVPDAAAAIRGAQEILIERIAELVELRQMVRETTFKRGHLNATKGDKAKANSKFEKYFDYHEAISALLEPQHSHRFLAVRRGAAEKELSLSIGGAPSDPDYEKELLAAFESAANTVPDSPGAEVLKRAARQALKGFVLPSIEAEVLRALKEVADLAAVRVFAENLRNLLLASPFGPKTVVGIDPGQRTGCKVAIVDDSGRYLADHLMLLTTEEGRAEAALLLRGILEKVPVRAIAIGNGTAGRETESFIRMALKKLNVTLPVVLVNEAGASVYSASKTAREEFPHLDVTVRGAISIARRLQDPLAELVKIDPRSIGVGQYQHDVAPGSLRRSLDQVVDSCVNQVGVNLNTASYHLLAHVSGIGDGLAKAIVERRASVGLFRSRQELLEVPRFSKKTFEQAAGFLRIPDAPHPFDNTGVHPERYAAIEALAARHAVRLEDLVGGGASRAREDQSFRAEVGELTCEDIVRELEKPGRDPREAFVPFRYRDDVHGLADLRPGMRCPGIVTNVTNFGAFVDVGVHHDGLVHLSQLSDTFVKDPREVVHPGMRVQVRVLEVNLEKQQLALSMKSEAAPRPPRERREGKPAGPPREREQDHRERRRPGPPRERREPPKAPAGPADRPRPAAGAGPRRPKPADHRPAPPARSSAHVPLNNPFAVLADLKKTLKPR